MIEFFPFRPGDWVTNRSDQIAKVKAIYEDRPSGIADTEDGRILFDLIIYNRDGKKIGRESPSMGGPKSFEPCCSIEGWERIAEPEFPIGLKWVDMPDGTVTAGYWVGERLPPAHWKKPVRRPKKSTWIGYSKIVDNIYRTALQQIAEGHNDARQLAKDTLGIK